MDTWSKTFFEQCTKHKFSNCNKPGYYIYSNDKILVDKNEIINEFIKRINMSVSYNIQQSEEDYNTKEKAIKILKKYINQNLLGNSSQEGSIKDHKFDPENYPGVSITQFLHDNIKLYTDFTGISEQVLYSALNYDTNYIYPLIKAMGKVLKESSDHNDEAKKICQTLLKSIAWMSAKTYIYIYKWNNNDDHVLDKLTREEIIDLASGLIIQWTRRDSVLYAITKKHISFLFSKGASAQEFLNLFKVFNKPESIWNNEFKRRDIENEYLLSKYYR